MINPEDFFLNRWSVRHNQRRLEHLASLELDLFNKHVFEVGAGIREHTEFYLDRGCSVVVSEPREDNLKILSDRFADESNVEIYPLDLNQITPIESMLFESNFEIVHCYGVLYHLENPTNAISFLAKCCSELLLIETCVSYGDDAQLNSCIEDARGPSQSITGIACRPTRQWLWEQLNQVMPYVYCPITQPSHPEFPLNWEQPSKNSRNIHNLSRTVLIGSHVPLDKNKNLVTSLPKVQVNFSKQI